MVLEFFDVAEKFMLDNFLLKLTQFEKAGSIGKTLFEILLRNLKINSIFEFKCQSHFPWLFNFCSTIVELPFFTQRNELNLEKHTKQTAKIKIDREQILRLFPEKKTNKNQQDLYKSLHYSLSAIIFKRKISNVTF